MEISLTDAQRRKMKIEGYKDPIKFLARLERENFRRRQKRALFGDKHYLENRDKYRENSKRSYEANKEARLELHKAYREANKEYLQPFRNENQRKRNFIQTKGSFLKGDEWNDFVIEELNDLRPIRIKETGFHWEIDHIIPLMNEKINGLHVWYNLRLIPRCVNKAKHNKLLNGV